MSGGPEEEQQEFLRRLDRALSVLAFHVSDDYWRDEAQDLREELQEILRR